MRFIFTGLVFYLLVSAYFAARRVIKKRQLAKTSSSSASTQSLPSPIDLSPSSSFQAEAIDSSVVDPSITGGAIAGSQIEETPIEESTSSASGAAEVLAASMAEAEPFAAELPTSEPTAPDLSAPALVEMESAEAQPEAPAAMAPPIESAPTAESAASSGRVEASSEVSESGVSESGVSEPIDAASPVLPIGAPVLFDADKNLTLAVSLSVTDIVNPDASGAVAVPDLIPTDPAISQVLNTQSETAQAHHPSIIEEIAELRPMADANTIQAEDPARRCMHALQTGDGTIRVAAVYELGELAVQRQGREAKELIEQLQILTEDEDPDVRLQAIAALAKVQG